MTHRIFAFVPLVILSPALLLSLAAQSTPSVKAPQTKSYKPSYKPPKTAWGDPDLQGLWPGSVNIPLQRPASMGTRSTLTEQEFAARDEAERKRVSTQASRRRPLDRVLSGQPPDLARRRSSRRTHPSHDS